MRRALLLVPLVVGGFACGSPSPRPAADPASVGGDPAATSAGTAEPTSSAASGAPAAAAAPGIPTSCANGDGTLCVPDAAFVKRLCNGSFPDVALVLMAKAAPFTRMYMKGDVDAWNADGGASARGRLIFDEEMLVLKRRSPPANGIVVGAGAGYLVMRWDGNCYTLEEGELTTKKPPSLKSPSIPWRLLSERTKNALLARPKILEAFQRRGRECKGAISGQVTRTCEQADTALSRAIVSEMREGATIPDPDRLP